MLAKSGIKIKEAAQNAAAYDVTLDFSHDVGPGPKGPGPGAGGANPAEPSRDSDDTGPTIFTALQEQLGLKLESRKGPSDLLIVDSVNKMPTGIRA